MKKARIVLSAVAVFAVIGGAFAFKAMRNGIPTISTTTAVSTFGTLYTLAGGGSFFWTNSTQFVTTPPNGVVVQGLTTTTAPATAVLTLTRVGGTQTITIPNYATVTALTTTRTTAID